MEWSQLGQANGVHFTVVHAERDVGLLAAIDGNQVVVTGPPQQSVAGQALFARVRVEVKPVVAVVAAQPQLGGLRGVGHQADGVHLFHRYVGNRQQQVDHLGLFHR